MHELRRARPHEAATIAAFQRGAYERNRAILGVEPIPVQADYADILRDYEVWLYESESKLAGVLIVEPRRDDLLIWSVATAPGARSRGLGNRLLVAAETRARELGKRLIRLYTGELLVNNVGWYQRRGYAIERTETMSDRRIVHMKKTIKGD
jgi:ribosomal protein S18 acetylase RimI-like enzyme